MSIGYKSIRIGEGRTERQFNHHLMFSNIRKKALKGVWAASSFCGGQRPSSGHTVEQSPNAFLSWWGPVQGPATHREVSLQACTEGIQQTFSTHF